MVAFPYRMPAFVAAGEINRAHPFWTEPVKTMPGVGALPTGAPVVVDRASGGVRPLGVADTADPIRIWGIISRPYPFQASEAGLYGATPLGQTLASPIQVLSVLREGYIGVSVAGPAPAKGDPAFIWTAASAGAHVQGGFESVETAGSTVEVESATFNGPPDAGGLCELILGPY